MMNYELMRLKQERTRINRKIKELEEKDRQLLSSDCAVKVDCKQGYYKEMIYLLRIRSNTEVYSSAPRYFTVFSTKNKHNLIEAMAALADGLNEVKETLKFPECDEGEG